jgi:hypothetical protein
MIWAQVWNGFNWVTLAEAFNLKLAKRRATELQLQNQTSYRWRFINSVSGEVVA